MKVKTSNQTRGFTLIEMIGVLAVIAILAAVLIPKVFEAINNSRVNNAAMGCQTMKTAAVDHYGKYGNLLIGITNTANAAGPFALGDAFAIQFDSTLLKEQLVDKLFQTKISDPPSATTTRVELVDLSTALTSDVIASAAAAYAKGDFNLDGDAGNLNDITGSIVAVAILTGVQVSDMLDLSKRIDGDGMSELDGTTSDYRGRVIYDVPTGSGPVYVYLTHR